MKNSKWKPVRGRLELGSWLGALVLLALISVSALPAAPSAPQPDTAVGEIPLPPTPASVLGIVEVHPFNLKTGYHHEWMASRPLVSSGLLVVLQVAPEYVVPRDAAEPVLYAGDFTVQRLSQGQRSGYVIGILPAEVDLSKAMVFFGRPELPERVSADTIAAENALAQQAGIKAFSAELVGHVQGDALDVEDLAALLRGPAADLVLKYSPDEKDLAETWRLPSAAAH